MIEIPSMHYIAVTLPLISIALIVFAERLQSSSRKVKETNLQRSRMLSRLGVSVIFVITFIWVFGVYFLTQEPEAQERVIEEAYGIEIESGWPDKQLEKNSPFLIIYTDGDETFKGEVTVEDRKATVYSLTKGDPIPLASE